MLHHHSNPDQSGTLQIESGFHPLLVASFICFHPLIRLPDTVAFLVTLNPIFRDSDVALLIFDVHQLVMPHVLRVRREQGEPTLCAIS